MFFKVDGFSALVQSSVLGKGVKHKPPPIKLPSSSATSSSGKQLFVEDMKIMYILLHSKFSTIYSGGHQNISIVETGEQKGLDIIIPTPVSEV